MTERLYIEVDTRQAEAYFAQLRERSADLSDLMSDIGEALVESTWNRWDRGVGPDGVPWVPLADGSGRTPLLRTRAMRDGLFPSHGADWVELSLSAKQARWHQEGTKPYQIKPKKEGAPMIQHPGLPARPMLGLSTDDHDMIARLAAAYLEMDPEAG